MKAQYIEINKIGDKLYYSDKKMSKLHRVDGPAIEYTNGNKEWYFKGKLHRENGPAVERLNGDKYWSLHGICHREDGPACEWANGDKVWYINGICHREDGPAIEHANGNKKWCLHGSFVSQEEHARRTKKVPTININGKDFTLEELNSLIETAKGNKA